MQKTICVDFDGVIADYSKGFQGRDVFGEPLHGAGASMGALKESGWRVIIFTTRPDTPELREYLRSNGIPYDYINENPDQPEGASGKIIADVYLDDRAVRFKGWADFRYALDAMVKEGQILEAAKNDDWQALKQLFESANPNNDWDGGIVLADNAEEAAKLTAINAIRQVNTFQNLAEWFASAFDVGPASLLHMGLSDAARNIDAIFALAKSLKGWRAVYDDQGEDIEDRIDAQNDINRTANSYNVALPGGGTVNVKTFERITGIELLPVKPLMSSNDYGDFKLTQFRDKAQAVMLAAGVDPAAAIQRIKDANDRVTRATDELSAKVKPVSEAYTDKMTGILLKNGYAEKKQEVADIQGRYQALRAELAKEKPADFTYARGTTSEDQIAYVRNYEAWSAKMQGLWEEQHQAVAKVGRKMQDLYESAEKEAGDFNAMVAPFQDEYRRLVEDANAEIAAARAEIGKIKEHVLATSPVSKEAADRWFEDMVLVTKNMQGNLKKRGYDPEKLRENMTEFYRMTGGRLARISFETRGGQRAAAMPGTGVVYVAGTFSKRTFFHEMAHILEDDERTKATSNRFLDQRTGRDKNNTVYTLKSLTGNNAYSSKEKAYKDSFIDPYVGKYYSDKITEVFSMGMQYFTDPSSMAVLFEKDPDHFNFMLGFMATPPRLDKGKVEAQQSAMVQQKDTLQSTESFLKELDKKISKAGDFWTKEGLKLDSYKSWRGGSRYYAEFPIDENGTIKSTPYVKSEKALKRMLWLWLAAGKPERGDYSLNQLAYTTFVSRGVSLPKAFIDGIQGAL